MVEPDKIHRNELLPPPKNHQKLLQYQYSAVFEAEELKEFSKPFGKESCTQSSKIKLDVANARRS
ncbi:BgTH12-07617 [Blumeria graminis f. sp. triticale]|uniref:BgTH12-07617 n=1 Tax=Blumeria graminis f. sp. triticale TaxID=1689686 RepID=A0A9W4CX44_BLUGR|nr:BgTH12-07617 [Blumeria graminis f. sp. triticale]